MTKSARRTVVVTWFHDHQIGYQDFSARLRALADAYRLTIVSRRPLPETELSIPGANVVVFKSRQSRGTPELAGYWFRVASYLRLSPCDLIVHLGTHTAALAKLNLGAPQAIYWNDLPSHYLSSKHPPKRWVTDAMRALQYVGARNAALLMPIGDGHTEDLLARGCSRSRISMIPMGVAESFAGVSAAPNHGEEDRPLRVVYTGSVQPDRGSEVMIEAVALANRTRPCVQLTIVGALDEQRQACLTAAQRFGCPNAVRVFPRVTGSEIPRFLANADFGICLWADLPHYRTSPPTKLFEYLVAGLPVLASNIRTHTSYLRDGENGYLFDYNPESLAECFRRAWKSRSDHSKLRAKASESGSHYRWSVLQPAFLDSLRALHP